MRQHCPQKDCLDNGVIYMEGADFVLMKATMSQSFGHGFTAEDCELADAFEVWGTKFSVDGDDYVEYRLLKVGTVAQVRRVNGY